MLTITILALLVQSLNALPTIDAGFDFMHFVTGRTDEREGDIGRVCSDSDLCCKHVIWPKWSARFKGEIPAYSFVEDYVPMRNRRHALSFYCGDTRGPGRQADSIPMAETIFRGWYVGYCKMDEGVTYWPTIHPRPEPPLGGNVYRTVCSKFVDFVNLAIEAHQEDCTVIYIEADGSNRYITITATRRDDPSQLTHAFMNVFMLPQGRDPRDRSTTAPSYYRLGYSVKVPVLDRHYQVCIYNHNLNGYDEQMWDAKTKPFAIDAHVITTPHAGTMP